MKKHEIPVPQGFRFLALSFFPYLTCYRILTVEEHFWSTDFSAYDLLVHVELCGKSLTIRTAFQKRVYSSLLKKTAVSDLKKSKWPKDTFKEICFVPRHYRVKAWCKINLVGKRIQATQSICWLPLE